MKNEQTALLGAAIGAGLLWLIKKNKDEVKRGVIDPDYMSYDEIKKQIDLQNRHLIADSHIDFAVGKNKIGYYIVFTHYGLAGKDDVTARYITSETYMKLRTEDGIPETTEDIAVSGIGAARKQKRFYVYAGYYENFITSEPMPAPFVKRRSFGNIEKAIDYAESFGDEVIYCDNVKYDLPDYLYEYLQDNDYEYFIY